VSGARRVDRSASRSSLAHDARVKPRLPRSAAPGEQLCFLSEHAHHFTRAPALPFAKMPSGPGPDCASSPALFGAHSPGPITYAPPPGWRMYLPHNTPR
jgi:hypothetical protein